MEGKDGSQSFLSSSDDDSNLGVYSSLPLPPSKCAGNITSGERERGEKKKKNASEFLQGKFSLSLQALVSEVGLIKDLFLILMFVPSGLRLSLSGWTWATLLELGLFSFFAEHRWPRSLLCDQL